MLFVTVEFTQLLPPFPRCPQFHIPDVYQICRGVFCAPINLFRLPRHQRDYSTCIATGQYIFNVGNRRATGISFVDAVTSKWTPFLSLPRRPPDPIFPLPPQISFLLLLLVKLRLSPFTLLKTFGHCLQSVRSSFPPRTTPLPGLPFPSLFLDTAITCGKRKGLYVPYTIHGALVYPWSKLTRSCCCSWPFINIQ